MAITTYLPERDRNRRCCCTVFTPCPATTGHR